eukprot:1159592-Pelagomonas_calceolata.AAC.1
MLEHISSVCAILKKREGTYCKPPKPSACYLLGNIHFMNLLKNLSVHSKKAPFSNFRDNLHHFDQSRNFTGCHKCKRTTPRNAHALDQGMSSRHTKERHYITPRSSSKVPFERCRCRRCLACLTLLHASLAQHSSTETQTKDQGSLEKDVANTPKLLFRRHKHSAASSSTCAVHRGRTKGAGRGGLQNGLFEICELPPEALHITLKACASPLRHHTLHLRPMQHL